MKTKVADEEDKCVKVEKTQNGESVSGSSICVSGYMRLKKAIQKCIRFDEFRIRLHASEERHDKAYSGSISFIQLRGIVGALMVDKGGRCSTDEAEVDLNQNMEYIPEEPTYQEYRDPTPPSPPPSVDEYSPGQTQSVPSVPSGGTSSSRGSKRKAPMVDMIDAQFDKLTTSLDGFTNVLDYTNVHFGVISGAAVRQVSAIEDINQILRRTSMYTYTEDDIYEMLSAMNIADENLLDQCYDFLCSNPTCTKRLMRLPPHKRWNKLCKMISGDEC
ncbi:uncharacterized protein HKW66_Vig0129900 [Vigna angularis]|uniref:Uncharacterized protein n=1 Tax=Phaseolus angularis TaxID=3914 RepID=A0A8T0K3G7_PHAAN|nr:uncharacterized protein HKW66_Vig0129900 [Vigna angularis]